MRMASDLDVMTLEEFSCSTLGVDGEFMGKSNSNPESRSTGILGLCSLLLVISGDHSSVLAQSSSGAEAQLNINVTQIISPVSPTLYGLMTEEINHSYDGGLYAEIIQNRAFHANWEGTRPGIWSAAATQSPPGLSTSQPGQVSLCLSA